MLNAVLLLKVNSKMTKFYFYLFFHNLEDLLVGANELGLVYMFWSQSTPIRIEDIFQVKIMLQFYPESRASKIWQLLIIQGRWFFFNYVATRFCSYLTEVCMASGCVSKWKQVGDESQGRMTIDSDEFI